MLSYALHNYLVATIKLLFLSFHGLAKNALRNPFLFSLKFEKKYKHYEYRQFVQTEKKLKRTFLNKI